MHAHEHGHDHAHGHSHTHREAGRRSLWVVLVITGVFMLVELAGGIIANSLALLADAGHMFTDVGAIALSLFALWFAQRPAGPAKTFGYLRFEILAALLNGATLIVLSVFIFIEAVQRFRTPAVIDGPLMLGVASVGMVVNIGAAFVLHRAAGHSLNVRGAYLHVLGDLLGSVGAIAAAVIIMTTGWSAADPLISILVGALLLVSSWKLVRESVDVLLEAVPRHLDVAAVGAALMSVRGVDDVHDLHVWTLTSGYLAMSVHAVVADPAENQRVLEQIRSCARDRFGIGHVTVQIERPEIHGLASAWPRARGR